MFLKVEVEQEIDFSKDITIIGIDGKKYKLTEEGKDAIFNYLWTRNGIAEKK